VRTGDGGSENSDWRGVESKHKHCRVAVYRLCVNDRESWRNKIFILQLATRLAIKDLELEIFEIVLRVTLLN